MDNGVPSLVATGKRRREGFPIDEDVKGVKSSRQVYGLQRADDDNNEGFQNNVHFPGLSVKNLMRMQQMQQMQQQQQQLTSDAAAMTPVVTHLNLQQRVEAAAALQDLRGNISFQQPQIQQTMKYGIQQQQQHLPQMQQQVMKLDTSSLGDPSCQPPQSPLPAPPPPYIRTPPLHSEADVHNGSPTSSSSGPYPNLPNINGPPRTSQQCNAPIQLPELESDSSHSSLMHPSQSNILAQSKTKNVQNVLIQTQQSIQSSSSGMSAQHLRGHSPQSRMAHQADRSSAMHSTGHGVECEMPRQQADLVVLNPGLQATGSLGMSANQGNLLNGNVHNQNGHGSSGLLQNGMLNGVAFHHGGRSLPGSGLQNGTRNGNIHQPGVQVLKAQGDPARAGATILHQQGGLTMPSNGHLQQGAQNAMSNVGHNGMIHQQGGIRMQEAIVLQAGHMSSVGPSKRGHSGVITHQPVQGFSSSMQQQQQTGYPPLLRDMQGMQQVPNSWYPSIRDTTTISESQPSVSTSRLQHSKVEPVAYSMNSPMYSCVTELGSQRGISTATSQINQVQNGYRDVLPDQDLRQQGCGSSSNMMGKVLLVQTDPQGRKCLQGNNFSVMSNLGGDMSSSSSMISGAFDDPALLQRPFVVPQPKITRSFIKVYKLGSITRAVDINRFKDYTELRCELARMFNLDGQLDPKVGWQLVFTDNEDDLLLVGDDPWEEFVLNVRGIRILTPAEVYYYTNEDKCTAAAYNPAGSNAPKPM